MPTLHISDLDGTSVTVQGGWRARVMIRVHTNGHVNSPATSVWVRWSGSTLGFSKCVTLAVGQCTVESPRVRAATGTVQMLVLSLERKGGYTYVPAQNHDPDGDSTGTVITLAR